MADTRITIRNSVGARVPSVSEVTLSSGDSITFIAESDADVVLRFTREAMRILSPAPEAAGVEISGGSQAQFMVAAAAPGRYVVALQIPEDTAEEPAHSQMGGTSPVLVIKPSRRPPWGGPETVPETGDVGRIN